MKSTRLFRAVWRINAFVILLAGLLATGIETAYVPTEEGTGEYLVRVEPDLVRNANPYTFTSDVPAHARNVPCAAQRSPAVAPRKCA